MYKNLIYKTWAYSREYLFRKKIRKIATAVKPGGLPELLRKNYEKLWLWTGRVQSHLYPSVYGYISGVASSLYVPENVYYLHIEPVLNNRAYSLSYADKNFYENYLTGFRNFFPVTVLRCINGSYYDQQYKPADIDNDISALLSEGKDFIVKPAVETGGGLKVNSFRKIGGKIILDGKQVTLKDFIIYLKKEYSGSFVVQEKIHQHNWFGIFNESSLNTVRMLCYRSVTNNGIHVLHSVVRFGREGSVVDNQAAGGLSCGIRPDGKLNDFCIDKSGNRYTGQPFLVKAAGQQVPGYEKMKDLAIAIAPKYFYHRLLGFDLCLDNEGNVRILEINCKNIEINFLQMNNGPLFGLMTDEIIQYCKINRKSVVFDFYI